MAKFTVLCRVDAFIDYTAVVHANSAVEAAKLAADAPERYAWSRREEAEFDARAYFALDDDGVEIAESQAGDF